MRFSRKRNESQTRVLLVRDPDLVAIARIADQRRHRENEDLERILGKVRHILNRKSPEPFPTRRLELPAALRARVAAIPDAEERIRAIVEYMMSNKARPERNS